MLTFGRKSNAVPNNNKVMTNMTFICREREGRKGFVEYSSSLVERGRDRDTQLAIAIITHFLHAWQNPEILSDRFTVYRNNADVFIG